MIARKNLKDIVKKKFKNGESVWKRIDNVVVCKRKDKRDMLTISNKHSVEMVSVTNKHRQVTPSPTLYLVTVMACHE